MVRTPQEGRNGYTYTYNLCIKLLEVQRLGSMDDKRARQGPHRSCVDGPVIPLELWRTIATFLNKCDIGAVRATSKTLRACIDATRDELRLVAWKRPYRMWGDDVWMSKLLLRSPNVR